MKATLLSITKKAFLGTILGIGLSMSAFASYTLSTTMTSTALNTNFPAGEDTLIIAPGGVLTLQTGVALPASITTIIVKKSSTNNAGRIDVSSSYTFPNTLEKLILEGNVCSGGTGGTGDYSGNIYFGGSQTTITIATNTNITIQDQCNGSASGGGNNPRAAIQGSSSNNNRIYIGSATYAVGAGGGNLSCYVKFYQFVQNGGTPTISQTGSTSSSNVALQTGYLCGRGFNIVTNITGDLLATTANPINVTWELVTPSPGTATFTPGTATKQITSVTGTSPNESASDSIGVLVSAPGSYTFKVTVAMPLAADAACTTPIYVEQTSNLTIVVKDKPTAAISGDTALFHNSNPTTYGTIVFKGDSGTAEYQFVYNIDGAANQTANSVDSVFSITQPDTDPIGTYDYALVSVSDAFCLTSLDATTAAIVIQAPLPVNLLSFTCAVKENKAVLTWESATENGFSHYELEKSKDGVTFAQLEKVAGKGSQSVYTATDHQLFKGKNYYRLKMVDINGTYRYSNTVHLMSNGESTIYTVFPNPVTKSIQIEGVATHYTVYISNAIGQTLKSQKGNGLSNTFDVAELANGTYFINVVDANGVQVYQSKFLKH